ncbi:MAG: LysR family transcriptional regulator [Aquisalinus sp.]|nr:LysR family transcriptional regulator [Aquisalinus sp.]
MDWDSIRCFAKVAETGSLSRAASALNMSIATMARRIDSLEASLGVKLMRRTANGVILTAAGEAILPYADASTRQMAHITRIAQSFVSGPSEPPVRISSTEPVISNLLAPALTTLLAAYPGLRIEFDVDTGLSNLSTGDVDIAIRLAKPKVETLIGRKLTTIPLGLFRAPTYSLADEIEYPGLSGEQLLWLDRTLGPIPENVWLRNHNLENRAIVRSTSLRALEKACVAGLGIAPLPVYRGKQLGLEVVPGPDLPPRQPWIVFHRDNRNNRRIRSVCDWIADCFKKEVGH